GNGYAHANLLKMRGSGPYPPRVTSHS
ncbi:MAG: hypothetical protein H6Q77_1997, partial [Gemmatimonadetes bacterium]|nr:hypothetical protein [Gemmatimonadota bacterium]